MNSSLWVVQFKNQLWAKLEGVQDGEYPNGVSVNLAVVLDGFAKGQTPEQVAQEVYLLELKALGPKRNEPFESPE